MLESWPVYIYFREPGQDSRCGGFVRCDTAAEYVANITQLTDSTLKVWLVTKETT